MNLFPQTVLCNQYVAILFIQLLSHVVQPVSCPCWVISMSHTGFKQRGHFQWQYMQLPRGFSSGFLPCWVKALLPTLTHQKCCQFKLTAMLVENLTITCQAF